MKGFNPYITFDGTCEEALQFYKDCFGGEIIFLQYYADTTNGDTSPANSKIMHSEFQAEAIHLMACDRSPEQTVHQGTNLALYLSFKTPEEQQAVFDRLSIGAIIHMPLEATFWGSRLGVITDKFGIHWMLVFTPDE
jgi:PhnB protein